MNLSKLFEAQKKLDNRIVEEKGLQGEDLLDEKILALQVELGELANEWRGFKFWSEDQDSRTEAWRCIACGYEEDENIDCINIDLDNHYDSWNEMVNPLLEEYVDCLHFILSIGNDLNISIDCMSEYGDYTENETENTFNKLFYTVSELWTYIYSDKDYLEEHYKILFAMFVGLGELQLSFTWQQIEQAYYEKNKINHERQASGY